MNISIKMVGGVILSTYVLQAFSITLTPNQINNGNIPGSYSTVDFYTSDGSWAPNITLPKNAADKSTITIHADATYSSTLDLANTDIPLTSLKLSTGDTQKLVFDAAQQRWLVDVLDYTSNGVGATIPSSTRKIVRYKILDNNWGPSIIFPTTALPGAIIVIESTAARTGNIAADNITYASTMKVATGEKYAFIFHPQLKKWYIVTAPIHWLQANNLIAGKMQPPVGPRTVLTLPKKAASLAIYLPDSAGDRDRLRIVSQSDAPSTVRNENVDFSGSMQIANGDTYDFMWVAEKQKWVKMSSPSRSYNAGALKNGAVPMESIPTTTIYASNGNWVPVVALPVNAKPGDRVLFKSDATWGFQVVPGRKAATFTSQTISIGDSAAFIVDASNRWQLETGIITMLNIYSDKVAIALGEQGSRARQMESFRLTNEALENSRVNFRLKMVGLMRHRDQGKTLGDALNLLRDDPVVQAERKRLGANALYYEGAEEGCGLAWLNANAHNMVASGSINCGTTVMRHEFGHNMGLAHGDNNSGSTFYATGYTLFGTVMGGNSMPYYSTPKIYDPVLGMAIGIEGKIDAVRAMNERFPVVSNFR